MKVVCPKCGRVHRKLPKTHVRCREGFSFICSRNCPTMLLKEFEGETVETHSLRLKNYHAEDIKFIGEGNFSEGVRTMLGAYLDLQLYLHDMVKDEPHGVDPALYMIYRRYFEKRS